MDRARVLEKLRESAAAIERHARCDASDHDKTYGPGKWSVRQLMAHLADCEFITLWRFSLAVAEPGSPAAVFNENHWAKELGYERRPLECSRDLFLASRRMLIHNVSELDATHLAQQSHHPEKGAMSGWQWAELAHAHADHHLGQIAAALEGRPWTAPPSTTDSWKYRGQPRPT